MFPSNVTEAGKFLRIKLLYIQRITKDMLLLIETVMVDPLATIDIVLLVTENSFDGEHSLF